MNSVVTCSCGVEVAKYVGTAFYEARDKGTLKEYLDGLNLLWCCRMELIAFTELTDYITHKTSK